MRFWLCQRCRGIIQDHLIDLKTMIRTNEDMELLRQTPSTVLVPAGIKLPISRGSSVYEKIAAVLKRRKIGAFFYIGGNDSIGHRTETFHLFQGNRSGRKSHWHSQDDR
mgnify:CR=1 FL=1